MGPGGPGLCPFIAHHNTPLPFAVHREGGSWYCLDMELSPYLRPELVFHLQRVASRDDLFHTFSRAVQDQLDTPKSFSLYQPLVEREAQMPTSTPDGIAFPHAVAPEIPRTLVVAARVVEGVDFGVSGHPRCDLILGMFGSSENPWEHVRLLARMARIVHTESSRRNLRTAADADDLYMRLLEEDRSHE